MLLASELWHWPRDFLSPDSSCGCDLRTSGTSLRTSAVGLRTFGLGLGLGSGTSVLTLALTLLSGVGSGLCGLGLAWGLLALVSSLSASSTSLLVSSGYSETENSCCCVIVVCRDQWGTFQLPVSARTGLQLRRTTLHALDIRRKLCAMGSRRSASATPPTATTSLISAADVNLLLCQRPLNPATHHTCLWEVVRLTLTSQAASGLY